jgi:uncharacterized protein YegP (UPF0339 family)
MGHPKFEIKSVSDHHFMFNLTAKNGQVILTSQRYTSKESCKKGIESVKNNSSNDERFERKTAKNGQFFFNLKSANHQVIGSSEMYKSKEGMENGISSVKQNSQVADIEEA